MTHQFDAGAQLLWRYNREAVALRIAYLNSARPGGEAHTVLTTDIPGVEFGTLAHRIEQTVLRVLPKFLKRRITARAACSVGMPRFALWMPRVAFYGMSPHLVERGANMLR